MQIARVIGNVVSTSKSEKLDGLKLLIVKPIDLDTFQEKGAPIVSIDTVGAGDLEKAEAVLKHTDLVLCDVKFPTESAYRENCGGSLDHTLDFLRRTERLRIPVWVRHVVAPGLTDTPASLRAVRDLCAAFSNIEKIEWLPFKNICAEKYEALGIPFPMAGKPAYTQKHIDMLLSAL